MNSKESPLTNVGMHELTPVGFTGKTFVELTVRAPDQNVDVRLEVNGQNEKTFEELFPSANFAMLEWDATKGDGRTCEELSFEKIRAAVAKLL